MTSRNLQRLLEGRQGLYRRNLDRLAGALGVKDSLSLRDGTTESIPPPPTGERVSPLVDTRHHIAALSLQLQLALAVRCARRVQPVFDVAAHRLRNHERQPVHDALDMADEILSGRRPTIPEMSERHKASKAVSRRCGKLYGEEEPARRASACITVTMRAAMQFVNNETCGTDVRDAVDGAAWASRDHSYIVAAIRSDIDHVVSVSTTAILLPFENRSLWPNGPPNDWPQCVLWT